LYSHDSHVFTLHLPPHSLLSFFFFTDPATTEIYTLSLHDALPIFAIPAAMPNIFIGLFMGLGTSFLTLVVAENVGVKSGMKCPRDRKSTRLNSSHVEISYAVFCLKKKKKQATISSV